MKLPKHLQERLQSIKGKHKADRLKRKQEHEKLINDPDTDNADCGEKHVSSTKQTLRMISIILLQFFVMCGDTAIYPFFPQIGKEKGLTDLEIGFVLSAYEIAQFISMPAFGSLLLKWSPRSMCLVGSVIAGVMTIFLGALERVPGQYLFGLCMVGRFGAGFGASMLMVASQSMLLKVSTSKTSTVIAAIEAAIGAGQAVGPAFGSALFVLGGYGLVLWIIGGLTICLGVTVVLCLPEIDQKEKESKSMLDLLKIPGLCLMLVHCIILRLDVRMGRAGLTLWIITQGYIYSSIVLAWILRIPISLLITPSPVFDWIFHGKRYFWLTVIDIGVRNIVSVMAYLPPFQASINLAIVAGHPADSLHTYGMITGLLNCGSSLGAVLGPIMGGVITQTAGFPIAWTAAAALEATMAVAFILFLLAMKIMGKPLTPAEAFGNDKDSSENYNESEDLLASPREDEGQPEMVDDTDNQSKTGSNKDGQLGTFTDRDDQSETSNLIARHKMETNDFG